MSEIAVYRIMLWGWIGVAAVIFTALFFVTAPYGRHMRRGWGPTIPSRLGWVLMESVAVFGYALFFVISDRTANVINRVFLALWLLHYLNRAFIYPLRRRGGARPMPASIAAGGAFFNLVNTYLQSRWVNTLGPAYTSSWLTDPRFIAGVAILLLGFLINVHSDAVLRRLRGPGDTGYRVPRRGLHRLVASPNYFGEILEWSGWAIATWSLAGAAFAIWTIANLAPRALANHRWYRERFPDYPDDRKALIPFLL